jgi:Phage integrase, N-terminal SAM-like domain
MTIQRRLERAFDLRGTPDSTRRTYAGAIDRFERFFGRPATELGREHVEQFLLDLARERKRSPSTHNVYAGALKLLYEAVLERPDVMVRVPRRKTPMLELLTPVEIARLLAAGALGDRAHYLDARLRRGPARGRGMPVVRRGHR